MLDPKKNYVWYVAYASNLRQARFLTYILGGTTPGGKRPQRGCNDRSLPIRDEALTIPNGLYFGGASPVWGGPPAFITLQPGPKPTKARAYLITVEQFWDIVQDENHLSNPVTSLDLEGVRRQGSAVLEEIRYTPSEYSRIVYCGDLEGRPMFSFTGADLHAETKPPRPAYIQTIAIGLAESHGLDDHAITAYLEDLPGIAGNFTQRQLSEILQQKATLAVG